MSEGPEAQVRFPGTLGHTEAQARLHRALRRDQLHHGIILVGPRGVGKATLARGLACALHCTASPGLGCGACTACHRVMARTHAGVEWIEPEADSTTIKVGAARELANRLELAPFEGRHHVVVFDPAEALNEQALNALLKTLEEPRPGVHFVMITTRLDALLPTVLSRCLVVRLGRLDDATVEHILRDAMARPAETPRPEVPAERIALAVRLCEGSAGLAVDLALDPSLDAALALVRAAMEAAREGPAGIFGGERSPLWTAWSEAVGPQKTGRPARERAVAARLCDLWLLHLRELMRGRTGLPGLPAVDRDDTGSMLRRLDRIQALMESLDRNPNVRLALEQTLLELSSG